MSGPLPRHSIAESIGHDGRGTTVVEVTDLGIHGDEEDLFLSDVLETLKDAWEDIPEEFRKSAIVRFRAYGDYASMNADIAFKRPETDAELADRRRWLRSIATENDERDRREFARLQAKFKTL